MPPISKMIPSNYLKTGDVADGDGGELDVTIAGVHPEELMTDGVKKPKWVAYFDGLERGLVLNSTNIKKLADLCGSELSEDWVGKRVRLYVTKVQFRGDEVDAIRIKSSRSPKAQPPLFESEPIPF